MRLRAPALWLAAAVLGAAGCGGAHNSAREGDAPAQRSPADCIRAWNSSLGGDRSESPPDGGFLFGSVSMWVAQPAATRGDEAKATGCSFLFHTATRYLSISGEWNGTGLRFGVPPTIHGSWSDEQQEATSDNVVLRADGGLTFNELPRATPEWLEAFAVRSTADLGDPYPDHVRFDLDPDVVRVELRGAFTCDRACTYPAGAKPPTGTRAVYTIDARSHVVDSFSLGH